MGAFQEFLGGAARALDLLREAYGLIRQAADSNARARVQLSAAAEGTSSPSLSASLARLEVVGAALEEAAGHTVGGAEEFKSYLAETGAGGAIEGTGERRPETLRMSDFDPRSIHPDAVRELVKAGWPRNSEGRVSARADLYDDKGVKANDEPLTPYPYRGGPHRPELKPRFNSPDMTTTWHVESKLAMLIRNRKDPSATASVYLNVRRCGAARLGDDRPAPLGCTENFRHVIPRDTVVYVHVIQENGRTITQRVVGTGEGIW